MNNRFLRRRRRRRLPKAPARILALTKPVTCIGNSLTAGNISGTQYSYPQYLRPFVSGYPVANEGHGGDTPTQIADRATDANTTIYDTASGLTRAQQMAGHVIVGAMRNAPTSAIGVAGTTASILAQISRAVGAVTGNYFVTIEPNADVEPAGIVGWAQIDLVSKEIMRLYSPRHIHWKFIENRYSDGGPADLADLYADVPPGSTRRLTNGTKNSLHLGPLGNRAFAYDGVWPAIAGQENNGGWCPPYSAHWITGAAATAATTTAGTVFTAPFIGTADSTTIIKGDSSKFSLHPTTGVITCVNSFTPTAPWYEIEYEVRKGTVKSRGLLRLYIGSGSTACTDRRVIGNAMVPADSPTGVDTKAMSFGIILKAEPATDGRSMYLVGNESTVTGMTVERTSGNLIRVRCRNAAGTVVADFQSSTTFTSANGWSSILVSCDLNPATPVANVYINGVSRLSASPILTQGATISWSTRAVMFARSNTLGSVANIWLRNFWLGNSYLDWSVSGTRDEFVDSTTTAAIALPSDGAIGGHTPMYCSPGNQADLMWGRNVGTVGLLSTVSRPKSVPGTGVVAEPGGTFHPSDLGSKLLYAIYPPTPGVMSDWPDTVGALSRTAAGVLRPSSVLGTINTVADGVVFDGTMYLTGTTMGSLPVGATPGWIIGIARNDGYGDGQVRYTYARGGTAGGTQRRISKNAVDLLTFGDGTTTTSGSSILTNWREPVIYACHFEATQYTLRANGKQGTTTTGATLNTGTTRARIGASTATTAAQIWNGALGAQFELSDTATLSEIQKVEGWLAWTYGSVGTLDAGHPYKYARP